MREAKRQARSFNRVRAAHQREVAEDYVELIADLIDVTGEARAVDPAERLGVTNAAVNNALNRLAREGLVTRQRYRSIFLTEAGRKLAGEARERHRLVRDFLISIGVDAEIAEIDAEGIEHHTSEITLNALRRFLNDR
ncbi:MAG: manganese-binding transcriptional regulator MntR [Paracoccaceae bacterium]|nr:manganese-binding transcriptional regulator MntR [Paracoccaceae bacterium]